MTAKNTPSALFVVTSIGHKGYDYTWGQYVRTGIELVHDLPGCQQLQATVDFRPVLDTEADCFPKLLEVLALRPRDFYGAGAQVSIMDANGNEWFGEISIDVSATLFGQNGCRRYTEEDWEAALDGHVPSGSIGTPPQTEDQKKAMAIGKKLWEPGGEVDQLKAILESLE